jgi:hypothetical protein
MSVKLVSSGDGQALAIRDHLVTRVRERGKLELQRDAVRLTTLETGPWRLEHWTPFNELEAGEASSPGYRHALERQRAGTNLPYGLDVWFTGTKVLSLLWADNGTLDVIAFTRGEWEEKALLL